MATKPPFVPAGRLAAEHFARNGNKLVEAIEDVQLLRSGQQWQVNMPWDGLELERAVVMYSTWHQTVIAQLQTAAAHRLNRVEFSISFPAGTTKQEATQCAETYMMLLNLRRAG